MKKLFVAIIFLLSGICSKAQIPNCEACKVDTTGGYISIADTVKINPVCNYELLTAAHLNQTHTVKISRQHIIFWPAIINSKYNKSGYSRGHVIPYEDLAYDSTCARASMDLRRNLAPEPQSQNIGTELHSENYARQLAAKYGSVEVYAGTWGTYGNVKGINIPFAYWKIIRSKEGDYIYWMPTIGNVKYAALDSCRIELVDLENKIGFNPIVVIDGLRK